MSWRGSLDLPPEPFRILKSQHRLVVRRIPHPPPWEKTGSSCTEGGGSFVIALNQKEPLPEYL
jgi:hypothetical protein